MRKSVKEIEDVLQNHGYSIDTIIFNVMKTFKLKTVCHRVGFQKHDGYSASEIITLIVMLPLMLLKKCLLQKRVPKGNRNEKRYYLSLEEQ